MLNTSEKNESNDSSMEARYQRAQTLMQGVWSKTVAFNTTLIPRWISNSDCFWYDREHKNGKEFRLVNADLGSNEIAFDHGVLATELAKASGQPAPAEDLPINGLEITFSPLRVEFSAFNKRWKFDSQDQTCIEIEVHTGDWLVSPDGKKAAFIRNDNLWIQELDSGHERALTEDGEPLYSYACPPSAYGFKIPAKSPEALWSPDSKRLFTLQVDARKVNVFPQIVHVPQDGSLRPQLIDTKRIAYPGDDCIDQYRFLAIDVESGQQQEAQYGHCPVFRNAMGFFTFRNGWWGEDSRHAYFIDIERGGDHVARLVEFNTHTGMTRVLIEEETSDTCFKHHLNSHEPTLIRPVPASSDVIWYSERSGWAHLYLYDLNTGQLKHPITEGEWLVRDILHYDASRRELFIRTADRIEGRNAYYCDICRVNIDTGKLTSIQSTDHEYVVFDVLSEMAMNMTIYRDIEGAAGISPSGCYIVTTRSRADETPVSLLLDRDGNEVLILETGDVSGLPEGWQWPEPVKLKAADGKTDIYGVIYRPSDFSPEKSYPLVDISWNHKEGFNMATGSFTNNAPCGFRYLNAAAYAELGFIVVNIFGRGTSTRHRTFSADPNPELPNSNNQKDRVAAIRQLAQRFPYIDLDRVGAGGGFMSTSVAVSGLLGEPDFYKVGVSDSAVMDLRIAPAFWGESYAGLPSSADTRQPIHELAPNLQGKLLLMNGMLDKQISAVFRLVETLQQANKDFDLLILPNDGHSMCSYATRRAWDYLVKHLLCVDPPKEFKLTTSADILVAEYYAKISQNAAK